MTRYIVCSILILWCSFDSRLQGQTPRPEFASGLIRLLREKSVQDDLKLTADQLSQLTKFRTNLYKQNFLSQIPFNDKEAVDEARAQWNAVVDAALKDFLSATQVKRLKQIDLQVKSNTGWGLLTVVSTASISKELAISDEQKTKLEEVRNIIRSESPKLSMERSTSGREGYNTKLKAFREINNRKVEEVLTAQQKAKWIEMIGSKFEGLVDLDNDLYGK